MNKKVISVLIAVAIGSSAGFNCLKNQTKDNNGQIILANIEALSRDEDNRDRIPCHSSAREDSKRRYTKCAGCEEVVGWRGIGTESRCTTKN